MMNTKENYMATIDELAYYCRESNFFGALMFTGKWGCGKTYLIDNELVDKLGDKFIIIRISLFGESTVESIHQKVQKAYFQNVMLNMEDYVEAAVQEVPSISEEQAIKISEKTEKVKETVADMAEKISTSKWGGIAKFISGMAKKIPGVEKILSLNPSEYISVEQNIADKRVVLVFDDLERSNLNEVDVLGCINEYCENKKIKTIIVANEEKILESKGSGTNEDGENDNRNSGSNKSSKIGYSEIKEKIITRTVKNMPNYNKIITHILDEFVEDEKGYKLFLKKHTQDLMDVFTYGSSENIRSVKCIIQDFQRVFIELKKKHLEEDELRKYFQSFTAFMLFFKDGKLEKSEKYGYLLCDYKVEKEYPGFFLNKYIPYSIKQWIVEGEWNEQDVSQEIDKIIELQKVTEPREIVRNTDLICLDEEVIKEGLPGVLSLAYAGELLIDEYIYLLRNMAWARHVGYELPVDVDLQKLEKGVEIQLLHLCESDKPDTRVRSMITSENQKLLNEKELEIYQKISSFREDNVQMFSINKRKYLNALQSYNLKELYDCENKRFDIFDEDMSEAVFNCYQKLSNQDRRTFNSIFLKMWEGLSVLSEFKEESLFGFDSLKASLNESRKKELEDGYGLKAALTQTLIQNIEKIIEVLQKKNEPEIDDLSMD